MIYKHLVKAGQNITQSIESASLTKLWAGSKNQITKQCSSEVIEDLPDVLKSIHKRDQPINNQSKPIQGWWLREREIDLSADHDKSGTLNWLVKIGSIKLKNSLIKSIEIPEQRHIFGKSFVL